MRRRNKPKVAWFPKEPGSTLVNGQTQIPTNVISLRFDITGLNTGETITGAAPVILDQTHFADGSGGVNSLSDIENSGYRLRRIVGKCFVGVVQTETASGPFLFLCAGAFIILRTDTTGQPTQAIGEYDIFDLANDDSPWIWKREWMLQDGGSLGPAGPITEDWPFTNAEYGSIADGPHIDQKTARIVGKDERLFFVASAMNVGPNSEGNAIINYRVTPRVLGSMRTSLGNRNNASR
jgi:hypothetical protein